MKNVIIVASLLSLFLTSCTKTVEGTVATPNVQQQQSKEGGITSGGGGVLPADAITPSEVFDILEQAKTELRLFVNYTRRLSPQYYDMTSIDRFWFQDQNIGWALENTDLEYVADRPCYDEQGIEVDGSYVHTKPNAICISGFSTAPKLIAETAKKEIYALVIHELAHRVGADETEARELQRTAVAFLPDFIKRMGNSSVTINTMILFEHPLFDSNPSTSQALQKNFNNITVDEKIEIVNQLIRNSTWDQGTKASPSQSGLIDYKQDDLQLALETSLSLLKGALLSEKGGTIDFVDQLSLDYYNQAFAATDRISLFDLAKMFDQDILARSIFAKTLEFKKVKSISDYQTYLEIIVRGYAYLGSYSRALIHQERLPDLSVNLFQGQNPWIKAAGQYLLTQKNCELKNDKFANLTAFEVILNPEGKIGFQFTRPHSSTGFGDIKNDENHSVLKDGNSNIWRSFSGDRWPNESWSKRSYSVAEVKLSEKQLVVTNTSFEYSESPLKSDNIKTCVYDVVKQ